jgi:hypothetical protein
MIVKQSKTYLEMKGDATTAATTVDQYLSEKETSLKQENESLYTQLHNLSQHQPLQYEEILHHVRSFDAITDESYRTQNAKLFEISAYMLRWDHQYQATDLTQPHLTIENDYSGIEKTLQNIAN